MHHRAGAAAHTPLHFNNFAHLDFCNPSDFQLPPTKSALPFHVVTGTLREPFYFNVIVCVAHRASKLRHIISLHC